MRLIYDNYVDATAVSLIASTEDSNYPVTNIQDQRLSTRWRTTTITAQSVIVDLGSARAIDTVAILGHNIASVATVTLVGSSELYASGWSDFRQLGSGLTVTASVQAALAAVSSTRVAYIDAESEQLIMYAWSSSVWSTLGSALTIAGIGQPSLATLTASNVAFIDGSLDLLSTYQFSGSVWSLFGSALSVPCGTPAIASLTASQIAFIDATNDQLRTYAWSGSTWSVVGSALSVAATNPAMVKLTASTLAYSDPFADVLQTYAWSGSVWSTMGTALGLSIGFQAMARMDSTHVVMVDSTTLKMMGYEWNGSIWATTGTAFSFVSLGVPALAALNETDIAWTATTPKELRTYRSNPTLTAQQTISYDPDVMLKFFTSTSRRYWQVLIEGTTSGTYIEAGRVWLGTYLTVEPSSLVDFKVTKKRSDTVVYGKHRQKFADPGYGWRRFELSFPKSGASMVTAIETMYDTVGNHTSMIFCNFDTARDWNIVEPCYVSIVGDVAFTNQGRYTATYSLELEEDR